MKRLAATLLASAPLALSATARASSHADAPALAQDPAADIADFYFFRSPDNLNTVTLVATVWPFEEPGAGPTFPQFADDVRYNIKIDSNGDAREDIVYELRFRTERVLGDQSFQYARRIASVRPPDNEWYVRQYVTVTHVDVETGRRSDPPILEDGIVAPIYLGASTPNYGALWQASIHDVTIPDPGGGAGRIFCGPRDDPFFADLGSLSDDLAIRPGQPGNAGGGVDFLSGWNVLAIAIQVPITSVTMNRNQPATSQRPDAIVGAWATAERRAISVRGGGEKRDHGQWVQVSRAAIPLLSTFFVPSGQKDAYNTLSPRADAASDVFTARLRGPQLADELGRVYPLQYMIPPPPRQDLVGILGGNLHLGQTATEQRLLLQAADILRLDVTLAAAQLDGSANRLGLLAGMTGYPNGRRLDDDATDIMLRLASGVLLGGPFAAGMNGMIGDGVDRNDAPFINSFPYLAPPHPAQARGGHTIPPRR